MKGHIVLTLAAKHRNSPNLRLLLDVGGVDVNGKGARGRTALTEAILVGDVEVVKLLLESGARVDIEDDDGYTPLAQALQRVVSRLLIYFPVKRVRTPLPDCQGA